VLVVVENFYVEKCIFPLYKKNFFSTGVLLKKGSFAHPEKGEDWKKVMHKESFHFPQMLWIKLKTGIDVCSDIPNMILKGVISGL